MKYQRVESSVLEFKRELPTKQQVVKTIIGFCNMYGGKLVVGVDDDCEITGIDESQIEQMMEDVHRSIYGSCTPTIIPSLHIERIDDKLILVIEVSEGMLKPYFLSSLGKQEGTFIRVGTETIKATQQMVRELEWQSYGKYPDEMPVYPGSEVDIDTVAFDRFIINRRSSCQNPNIHELLYHYNILIKEHTRIYPTRGGLLLFGKEPQKYISEAFIICTHFLGTSGREVVATRDCVGSLLSQYNDCISFLLSRLNKQFTIEGVGQRKESLELPENALREVIINAIVHRNYLVPAPTKISIYDDRIEVFSPGNFPGPIQINHITMGVTYIRNVIITRVFREIGLMEKLGSGFQTLFEQYKNWNLPNPVVVEGAGFVKCILPRATVGHLHTSVDHDPIMELFYSKPQVTIQDVMRTLSISRSSASRRLNQLLENGIIKKLGKGPSTRYFKEQQYP